MRESRYDIPTIQEFLAHKDVNPTLIHTHVGNEAGRGVRSPVGYEGLSGGRSADPHHTLQQDGQESGPSR